MGILRRRAPEPRKGMPSPRLGEQDFGRDSSISSWIPRSRSSRASWRSSLRPPGKSMWIHGKRRAPKKPGQSSLIPNTTSPWTG